MTVPNSSQILFVGSGINSMIGAALLAVRGKQVTVLERNDRLGGCIRTEELFPGFTHEVLSSWHSLLAGSPAYAELEPELRKRGVELLSSKYSTGWVHPNGEGIALTRDLDDACARLEKVAPGDGMAFKKTVSQVMGDDAGLIFTLLGKDPYGLSMLRPLFQAWRKRGVDGLLTFATESLENFRRWSERTFTSNEVRTLIAPWTLHSGLGPDDACSALIGKLTFASVVTAGMPVIKGGGSRLVDALASIIEDKGGAVRTDSDVVQVNTEGQGAKERATGVMLSDGSRFLASEAVVCNVTPEMLYGKLIQYSPKAVRDHANGYRYGRGCMQIHFALSAKPGWLTEELGEVPLVHLTESMEQTCLSVTEANNGMLPSKPTLGIGQPVVVDKSRAPDGSWILWIQMQELPTTLKGDAAGEIATPKDGKWNEQVREAFADRAQKRLEQVMPGLSSIIVGRKTYSPADLERLNCNLVGGDPYSGICSPDQFFWLRPFAATHGARSNRTTIKNVYHIGATTHPGPGLGAGSGILVADKLSRR
ncbi:NAD(P)/FAD-dependent oxidoreductase [Pseudomonas sp. CFBP 8770]|uniref:phytoene desaturase family protein n=1 Tax=unclassified Pseudomonas TaxID=196821 RepID=UPI0017823987|nr:MULTISPECIES: NAD(P)/FAD-dependent oxidoreductase [unclassified Pseudomonas]MBD8473201.1 NAD(P)/FAD-dependent oxidoreductase [Pseudomonas sp. CFBP 8773]MBD8595913.1 NAD(P)/FAD-dependent oxidoreductase [Pseudomonas sp. CFBP 8758]MBD8646328.1 NAD(P)/FAD-dependent oxidoreductase [Pseudomonas sp. CFBP 8770]MBD8733548.1 NAD(P)/FAD-dependent oxidoreductase [Pseudomonas sp. CFBP 13710]